MIKLINISAQTTRKRLSFTCALVIVAFSNLCHASDISTIQLSTNLAYTNGVLEPQPYGFEVWLNGDLLDVASITVSTPPGSNVPTIDLIKYTNSSWGRDDLDGYIDLSSLRVDFATGDYVINFYDSSQVLIDSATLSYSPILPTGFAAITNPVPGIDMPYLSPLFTWSDVSAFGSFLYVLIDDFSGGNKIYESSYLAIDTLSWAPGDLMPASDYWLTVSVNSVNGFSMTAGIPTLPTDTSSNGDVFTYEQGGRQDNTMLISTSETPPGSTINFSGMLDIVIDSGGGIYSGVPMGTDITGFIDDVTANGGIFDGTTITSFGCCIAAGGLSVSNDMVLSADGAALLNALLGDPIFNPGDLVDGINIAGDKATLSAGRIEIGLSYIFDPSAFSNNNLSNYPFNPNDALLGLFFIVEENVTPAVIYSAAGQLYSINTTYLAPGWSVADFHILCTTPVICTPTRAIEFDSLGNLYIEDTTDDESGQIDILKLDASSGYRTSSTFASYNTAYKGATGLGFDGLGSLYVSERSTDGDAGIIRKIDVATQMLLGDVMSFANHRPTGVDADSTGNVFYSGRKESNRIWGKLFQIDSSLIRTELSASTAATGMALDDSGNIFISTPKRTDLPLLSNSIYMFRSSDVSLLNPVLIATFDARGGELTFDDDGNLYMVGDDKISIIKLSPDDTDGDGMWDYVDNCVLVSNAAQRDTDGDGYGNYCDPDFDNNLTVNAADLAVFKTRFFSTDPDADLNGSGTVNAGDLAILKQFFFKEPGPSGLNP